METSIEQTTYETPPIAKLDKEWAGFFYRYQWTIFKISLVVVDLLTTTLAFWLAYLFRFDFERGVLQQ